jgi:hypothetical protein
MSGSLFLLKRRREAGEGARLYAILLIMEAVTEFGKNLSGIVPVEPAEGDAVVQFHSSVGHV